MRQIKQKGLKISYFPLLLVVFKRHPASERDKEDGEETSDKGIKKTEKRQGVSSLEQTANKTKINQHICQLSVNFALA